MRLSKRPEPNPMGMDSRYHHGRSMANSRTVCAGVGPEAIKTSNKLEVL